MMGQTTIMKLSSRGHVLGVPASRVSRASLMVLACGALFVALLSACETETATTTVVDNAYPATLGGDPAQRIVVYKAWWQTTVFLDPVAPGAESQEERTVPATDFAYALLAPGWDPTSGTPPIALVPVKSKALLSVKRGDVLHIVISDEAFAGNCAAHEPLSQDDADFITQRIFPGDFATALYDAKTCTSKPIDVDAGADAASDVGAGAETSDGATE